MCAAWCSTPARRSCRLTSSWWRCRWRCCGAACNGLRWQREYIVVHELAHLHERHHNERFTILLDQHLPQWRHYRETLNQSPLGHEEWRSHGD
ncbi:MAG: M48 family metallopeptidase [Proteobacteria bacterium]|nr:M48 family metallopeptidase [Pseudomonadota bacterium]MBS0493737.1 M48 family metallopeptidase [Pseudomonadota bacterium]